MAQPALDVFGLEIRFLENRRVRFELDIRSVRLFGVLALLFVLDFAALETGLDEFPAAIAAHHEHVRERVHRLRADAVEADAELEHVVVVFRAGVDGGHAIHDLAQRDAAAEIAHGHARALDLELDFLAEAHDVFVNGVINDLLEQDVTAVVIVRAVADAANVHARAQADVLQRTERLDLALVVMVFGFFGHKTNLLRRNWIKSLRIKMGKFWNCGFQSTPPTRFSSDASFMAKQNAVVSQG